MTAQEKKLVDVYKRAQQRIFEKVTQTVAKGLPASYQRAMLNAVNRELARLTKQSVKAIEELLEGTYAEVMAKAKVNLDNWWKVAKIKGVQTYDTWYKQFTVLNRGAINELIDESVARLQVANAGLAKNLRDVITMKFASGETVDDTKNRIIEELYGSNGKGKLNIKGRNYDPTKYAELVARTATREATNKATIVEAEACGSNLVKMTSHSPTCSVCGPFQGRVYTTDPNNKDYPYLYEHAFKHGYNVVHPHCRHVVNAYIPELMSDDELKADKEHSNKSFKDPGQSKKDIERYMRVQKEQADLWRDTQQYARYKARLGRGNVPKTLHNFRQFKGTANDDWGVLQAQYRGMGYYNKAVGNEPAVTAIVKDIGDHLSLKVVGLENRIKGKESYLRKIKGKYSEYGNSYEVADILRYTYVGEVDTLVSKGMESLEYFVQKGYNIDKVKNYWLDLKNPYNGVNTVISSPTGQKFEVQFHTQESLQVKEIIHGLYEEYRILPKGSKKAIQLTEEMFELSSSMTKPSNIGGFKNVTAY